MNWAFCLVSLVFMMCYSRTAGQSCQSHKEIDRCSVKPRGHFLFEKKFTYACNLHDHCYNCVSSLFFLKKMFTDKKLIIDLHLFYKYVKIPWKGITWVLFLFCLLVYCSIYTLMSLYIVLPMHIIFHFPFLFFMLCLILCCIISS